jgi:hypothetical protein
MKDDANRKDHIPEDETTLSEPTEWHIENKKIKEKKP